MDGHELISIDVTLDRERRGLTFLAGITKIPEKFPDLRVSIATSQDIMRRIEALTRFDEEMGDIEGARRLEKVSNYIDIILADQYGVHLIILGNDDVRIRSFVGKADDLARTLHGWRNELIINESTLSGVERLWGDPLEEGQPTKVTSVDYIFKSLPKDH